MLTQPTGAPPSRSPLFSFHPPPPSSPPPPLLLSLHQRRLVVPHPPDVLSRGRRDRARVRATGAGHRREHSTVHHHRAASGTCHTPLLSYYPSPSPLILSFLITSLLLCLPPIPLLTRHHPTYPHISPLPPPLILPPPFLSCPPLVLSCPPLPP